MKSIKSICRQVTDPQPDEFLHSTTGTFDNPVRTIVQLGDTQNHNATILTLLLI